MSYCHECCQLHGFKLSLMNGLFDLFSVSPNFAGRVVCDKACGAWKCCRES